MDSEAIENVKKEEEKVRNIFFNKVDTIKKEIEESFNSIEAPIIGKIYNKMKKLEDQILEVENIVIDVHQDTTICRYFFC